ncbi:YaaL family protein [Clostridium thailandense]|uniref:YaaL family protein n=1 Tax=Clostridium thailandense TaxID=2794346 RepID=A0A949WX46_9CLOT|nr:YaaL family protein [Clostridium thailandense]MBV7275542.1 YaaL family protein [Clostridium thailandense]
MNKKTIASLLIRKSKYTSEQKKLLNSIEKAREDLEVAREYFNSVDDPRLIDYAIYREEAAKARYMFLLNEAKKNGLKATEKDSLKELSAV